MFLKSIKTTHLITQKRYKRLGTRRGLARDGQERQAQRVNAKWGANCKEVLEVRDIALIRIEGNTRAATDKREMCVKVTWVQPYTSPQVEM